MSDLTNEQINLISNLRLTTGYGRKKCKDLLELYDWDIEGARKPDVVARRELKAEVERLREGIKKHRDTIYSIYSPMGYQKEDHELWGLLGEEE